MSQFCNERLGPFLETTSGPPRMTAPAHGHCEVCSAAWPSPGRGLQGKCDDAVVAGWLAPTQNALVEEGFGFQVSSGFVFSDFQLSPYT